MKIKFEDNLGYQLEAIEAVTDIFSGQEATRETFSVGKSYGQMMLGSVENELGIGNRILLFPEEILKNLNGVQVRNGLPGTKRLSKSNYNFSVEMETGTGKTYVYLRTVMELNKKYGFTKFIVVVPSIAIKEGVYKSLEITKEHFKSIYENINYDYFIYDSKKLDLIRNFAVNSNIQIMVINIDSFNKDSNIINNERDQSNGFRPIDYIQQCNPIVIIDEPQNMESEKAKQALANLNPLCTLRYSATHKERYNPIFKLDSIDAYEKQLVKQIEVATVGVSDNSNTEYIKLSSVKADKNGISAKLEMDVVSGKKVVRKEVVVKKGDHLGEKAKRSIYDGYIVNDIYCEPGHEKIDLGKINLNLGQINGGLEPDFIKRLQISRTIREHLEKQRILKDQGIKVLSLFFIDKVANYRTYDENGNPQKGKYAKMFEEEYSKLIELPQYQLLGDQSVPLYQRAEKAHDGYFSADKKKNKATGTEYFEYKDTKGTTEADNDTFNKIMRDKEKLLSFDEPLSFIFSHSALREGWDNPNVFQICTLNETTSEMKKRQEIGRGLRIAVNQHGERVRGFEVNTLTVMANESYEQFVENLQKEMETEEGIKFGHVESHLFANIMLPPRFVGDENYLGHEKSEDIFKYLVEYDYIDEVTGKATDKLKKDILDNRVEIPEEYHDLKNEIIGRLKTTAGKLIIKNADMKVPVKIRKGVYLSPEFRELWDRVKYKTTYSVDFDEDKLIEKCREELKDYIYIPEPRVIYSKERLEINSGGIKTSEATVQEEYVAYDQGYALPDILTYLQNETNLTRDAIVKILTGSKTLESFKKDPQKYMEQSSEIIRNVMSSFIVDGIKYEKIGDFEYYKQELFETEDLFGYLRDELHKTGNMIVSEKSPYDHVVFDSTTIESPFAEELEKSDNVKVYAKLPGWFKIETPLGTYNPDWAILYNESGANGFEKLYFVVETKGSHFMNDLREVEKNKIHCGKEHFKALDNSIKFRVASSFDALNKS